MYLSIVAIPFIWLWNFKVGDYAFWSPHGASMFTSIVFTACWCFSTAVTLWICALLSKKTQSWRFGRFSPFCSLALGLAIGATSYAESLSSHALYAMAILIGANYGMLFFQWAFMYGTRQEGSGFFFGGVSLLALAGMYLLLSVSHLWEQQALVLVFPVCNFAIAMIFAHKNKEVYDRLIPENSSIGPQKRRNLLPVLTILAGFVGSVIVQSSVSAEASFITQEYAVGAAITGVLVLVVAKKLQSLGVKSYLMLFGIISAVISISILVSLILKIGSVSQGSVTASMIGFWLLFSFLMSVLSQKEDRVFFKGDVMLSFVLALAVFYCSIAVTKLLCLALGSLGQINLTISAVLLAFSASLAFYIGVRNGLSPTEDHFDGTGNFETSCLNIANQSNLTTRELDVMMLLARGNSLNHIADRLFLSPNTVKTYRSSLYRKLNIHNRQDLINLLNDQGSIDMPVHDLQK